jgi:hypothetical protein
MMTSSSPRTAVTRAVVAVSTAALLVLPACRGASVPSGSDPIADASVVVTVPPTIGPSGCDPSSRTRQLEAGLEVKGTIDVDDEDLWALFETQASIPAGQPVDVYWRIGGDKALRISLVGVNDQVVTVPAPIPTPHPDWDRPGEPWMSTITFPQPGCWRVFVERSKREGDLWVVVS